MPDNDLAHFPEKYHENYLYLLEVDPTHIHALWEVIPENIPDQVLKNTLKHPDLCLKIYCDFQECARENLHVCFDLQVQGLKNDWFIELEKPLLRCQAELGYYDPLKSIFTPLCHSNELDIAIRPKDLIEVGKKRDPEKPSIQSKQKIEEETKGFLSQFRKDRSTHPKGQPTEAEIKAYYQDLPRKLLSNPGFSPWKSLLEKMGSEEALRTFHYTDFLDLLLQKCFASEIHSSNRSTISFFSSHLESDQDL